MDVWMHRKLIDLILDIEFCKQKNIRMGCLSDRSLSSNSIAQIYSVLSYASLIKPDSYANHYYWPNKI